MDQKGFKLMEPVLVAKNLSKKYGTVVALESANLELYPGEVLGVIGAVSYTHLTLPTSHLV